MRAPLTVLTALTAAVLTAPAAHACDGAVQAAPVPATATSGGSPGTSSSHGYGYSGYPYYEAPSVPISALPTLQTTRGYSSPASGYYAPGPAVGVYPLPRPLPHVYRSQGSYVYRTYNPRPYRRVVYR